MLNGGRIMTEFWLIVALCVIGILTVVWIFANRRKRFAPDHGLPESAIVEQAENIRTVAMSDGIPTGLGFKSGRGVRVRTSLFATADRVVVVTREGKIADLVLGAQQKLKTARCTAPGRLVVEGTIPQIGRGDGLYRLELNFAEAKKWESVLLPFVETGSSKFHFS